MKLGVVNYWQGIIAPNKLRKRYVCKVFSPEEIKEKEAEIIAAVTDNRKVKVNECKRNKIRL
jgi:transcriptional regulator CtsR